MKRLTLLFFILASFGISAGAQSFKVGHINTQELVSLMSEMDSARIKLEVYRADLVEAMDAMQNEYNTKYTEYSRKKDTWTAVVRTSKEEEIQGLIQRIQQFEQTAQQDMQNQQQLLMSPVYEKAQLAINKVAKEQGLSYVFDISSGAIIFMGEGTLDLLPLAKAELKIPAEKVAPTQLAQDGAAK